jgi:hypothetical protein
MKDNQNRNQVETRVQRVGFMPVQIRRRSPVFSYGCGCDCSVMVVVVARRRLINLAHKERRTTRTGVIVRKTMLNVCKTGSGNKISVEANTSDRRKNQTPDNKKRQQDDMIRTIEIHRSRLLNR